MASTEGENPVAVDGAPALTGMDWQPGGPLVGIGPDGTVLVSEDPATRTWRQAGALDGPAEAVDAVPGRWHAATERGVFESTDDGKTWHPVISHER